MVKKINQAREMSFLRMREMYPNDYILVRIVKLDRKTGADTGIALYTSPKFEELFTYAKQEGSPEETITLHGENLIPMIGGLL